MTPLTKADGEALIDSSDFILLSYLGYITFTTFRLYIKKEREREGKE